MHQKVSKTDHQADGTSVRTHPAAQSPTTDEDSRDAAFHQCLADVRSYRDLPDDWDTYGGSRAQDRPIAFSVRLLENLHLNREIPPPAVRPISNGAYMEWRYGDSLLYFEVDDESVLSYVRTSDGEETVEDSSFNVDRAKEAVLRFIESNT